jgi:transposase-like protein
LALGARALFGLGVDMANGKPGREKALNDSEYMEAMRRVLGGESIRKVAASFGVGQSSLLRRGVTADCNAVKAIAGELVEVEQKFAALPVPLQVSARLLANELQSISEHLAGAAKYGAQTAHRLSYIANAQVDSLDAGASLEENSTSLRSVMAFTESANKAAEIGLKILASNKDTLKGAGQQVETSPDAIPPDAVEASHVYQRMMNGG